MGRTYENRKASMAKTGAMKTKLYSKYGKEIYICAKNGGVDPDGNLALRRLIERAKKDQVPGLGNMPVIGNLFKGKSSSDNLDELLVFIAPRIL